MCVFPWATSSAGKHVLINTGSRQGARRQVPRLCGHPVAVSCTKQAASFKFMLDKHAYGHSSFPVGRVTPQQSCETLLKQETTTKATHRSPMAAVFATQLKCSFIRKTRGLRQETTNVFAPLCISRTAWGNSKPQEQEVCCSCARWDDWCSAQLSGLQGRLQPYGDNDIFRGPAVPIGRSEPSQGSRLPCAALSLLLSFWQPWVARVPPLADLPVPRGGLTVHFVVDISA